MVEVSFGRAGALLGWPSFPFLFSFSACVILL